jgi:hypothetical protein
MYRARGVTLKLEDIIDSETKEPTAPFRAYARSDIAAARAVLDRLLSTSPSYSDTRSYHNVSTLEIPTEVDEI